MFKKVNIVSSEDSIKKNLEKAFKKKFSLLFFFQFFLHLAGPSLSYGPHSHSMGQRSAACHGLQPTKCQNFKTPSLSIWTSDEEAPSNEGLEEPIQ